MIRTLLGAKFMRLFLFASVVLNALLFLRVFHKSPAYPNESINHRIGHPLPIRKFLHSANQMEHHVQNSTELPIGAPAVRGYDPVVSLVDHQVVFVGGVPRSGTTLVRAMLDAHPDIRCGEETRVIPRIVSMRSRWDRSSKEHNRLEEARIDGKLLDEATRAFIDTIILGHGSMAPYLCNKDPLVLNYLEDMARLYPHAKFVLLIRDGRAVAHSIVSRNVTISGVNNRNYLSAAMFWNKLMTKMTGDCDHLGEKKCIELFYEKLVENPKLWMQKLLQFLGIPWHDNVLRHQDLINKEISLSKFEPSSSQVRRAVHRDSVSTWRTKIPPEVQQKIYTECDMLKELGYPPPPPPPLTT